MSASVWGSRQAVSAACCGLPVCNAADSAWRSAMRSALGAAITAAKSPAASAVSAVCTAALVSGQ